MNRKLIELINFLVEDYKVRYWLLNLTVALSKYKVTDKIQSSVLVLKTANVSKQKAIEMNKIIDKYNFN